MLFSTGVHTVADVFCVGCGDRLGWYYHKASDQSQKYKEGRALSMRFIYVLRQPLRIQESTFLSESGLSKTMLGCWRGDVVGAPPCVMANKYPFLRTIVCCTVVDTSNI